MHDQVLVKNGRKKLKIGFFGVKTKVEVLRRFGKIGEEGLKLFGFIRWTVRF